MAETIYNSFVILMLIVLAIVIFGYFIRTVLGPHFSDRILAVNSISTVVMLFISFITGHMERWVQEEKLWMVLEGSN